MFILIFQQKVATVSLYSFAKETPGCNLSGKQQNERTEDVYNHLHEQTEHDDDNYDHACTAPNHGTDLSEYSHLRDVATVQSTSPFLDGGDYSTLGQWISRDCQQLSFHEYVNWY